MDMKEEGIFFLHYHRELFHPFNWILILNLFKILKYLINFLSSLYKKFA